MSTRNWDAVVVGAGPNGLAAAVTLARAGMAVLVVEAASTIGGGSRTAPLTLPGFSHDVCSAIHPLGVASPFFKGIFLKEHGLDWIDPPLALAHPFDDGSAALLSRDMTVTAESLGRDGKSWRKLMQPLARHAAEFTDELLGPIALPRHPLLLARFGLKALRSAQGLADGRFEGERAKALFTGMAAHSMLRLDQPSSAAFGLVLGLLGHAVGWPLPRGGSQQIIDALASYLLGLGGEIQTGVRVESLDTLPPARTYLLNLTPRQVVDVAGPRLGSGFTRQLGRYRYGPGVFKVDYALDGPVPWTATECAQAGTVHIGGTMAEIVAGENAVSRGEHPERPYVLVAQQSLFDSTRAPAGKHTLWAYCHVPNGSTVDMTARIDAQIERFAPGFRERILARHVMFPADLELYNANYIGGDINGGIQDLRQLFTRPTVRLVPYSTSAPDIFICSSSTPPGGGVHGMCGFHAARTAMRRLR